MNPFEIGKCLRFGWEAIERRPAHLIVAAAIIGILSAAPDGLFRAMAGEDQTMRVVAQILSFVISILVGAGSNAFYLKAHDDLPGSRLGNLWYPEAFLPYLLVYVLIVAISIPFVVAVGILATASSMLAENHLPVAIVCGIAAFTALSVMLLFMMRFVFAPILIIDRTIGVIDAMKASQRLMRGRVWRASVLATVLGLVVLAGLLFFFVGVFATWSIAMLAWIHAYRVATELDEAPAAVDLPAAAVDASV